MDIRIPRKTAAKNIDTTKQDSRMSGQEEIRSEQLLLWWTV